MTPAPETTVGDVPEMVERAARAIAIEMEYDPDEITRSFNPKNRVPRWMTFVDQARAAIAAIREPNEAMRYAVWFDQYMTCGGPAEVADELARKKVADEVQKHQDISSFSALIDAALGNPPVAR